MDTMGTPTALVIVGLGLVLYFVPSLVASSRGRRNGCAIFALNLFLGWSLIGWVVALVWALTDDKNQEKP